MDGRLITEIRTAASTVATKAMAAPGAAVLAVLGTGVQARAPVEALRLVRDFRGVRIWDRSPEKAARLAGEVGGSGGDHDWGKRCMVAPVYGSLRRLLATLRGKETAGDDERRSSAFPGPRRGPQHATGAYWQTRRRTSLALVGPRRLPLPAAVDGPSSVSHDERSR